jgi:hypothetical protein
VLRQMAKDSLTSCGGHVQNHTAYRVFRKYMFT